MARKAATIVDAQLEDGKMTPRPAKKTLRGLITKRWKKIRMLAMSLGIFKPGSRVKLQLTPVRGKRKTVEGVDVARRDMYANTMHNAIYDGDVSTIAAMLEQHDLDPDIVDSTDESNYTMLLTCVSIAEEDNNEESISMARLLLEKGANVNHVAEDGSTTTLLAAYQNNVEMLEMLIECAGDKIDHSHTIQNGATALYLACQDGYLEVRAGHVATAQQLSMSRPKSYSCRWVQRWLNYFFRWKSAASCCGRKRTLDAARYSSVYTSATRSWCRYVWCGWRHFVS